MCTAKVVTTYGNHSNGFYLLNYGFVVPDNPFQTYRLGNLTQQLAATGWRPADTEDPQHRSNRARLQQVSEDSSYTILMQHHHDLVREC